MRLGWIVALLVLPAAAGQAPLAPGELDLSDARHTSYLYPRDQGVLKMGIDYACRDYDATMEDLRLVVDANATSRQGIEVPVDYASHYTLRLDECRSLSDNLHIHVEITFTMPAFDAEDTLDVEVSFRIASDDAVLPRGSGEPLTVSRSIPMTVEPASDPPLPTQVSTRVEESDLEQAIPAPTLPLLVSGLACLAAIRRFR